MLDTFATEHICIIAEQNIIITKSGKRHRISDSTSPSSGYFPITGKNRARGEIPFFIGYTRETEVLDGTKWRGMRNRLVKISFYCTITKLRGYALNVFSLSY